MHQLYTARRAFTHTLLIVVSSLHFWSLRAHVGQATSIMATVLLCRGHSADRGQSSWLQRSVHSLAKHKKSLLAGAAAGFAVGASLWMTR